MDPEINPKLLVFNDVQYAAEKSFLNLGPLALIGRERLVWYEPAARLLEPTALRHVDHAVAERWHTRLPSGQRGGTTTFDEFVVLATCHVCGAVTLAELRDVLSFPEHTVRALLKTLFASALLRLELKRYTPTRPLDQSGLPSGCVSDIVRLRARWLNQTLNPRRSTAVGQLFSGG
jgi:hypothetical protein